MASRPRHIGIVALRRSGTTTLWRAFRQDTRFRCYDEPFNPLLRRLPADHRKHVWGEFIELFEADPKLFKAKYAPIPRAEEMARGMSLEQKTYLSFLTSAGPTVFDVTRCTGKIPELKQVVPDAVLVHLYRHPAAFVSSHLLPSDRLDLLGVRRLINRLTFFTRSSRFDGWGFEQLLRTGPVQTTQQLLAEVGVDLPPANERVPASQRLLSVWLGAYRLAEREGPLHFGERFISLPFESFCSNPQSHLERIYTVAEVAPVSVDLSGIRPATLGYRVGDPTWRALAERAGFDEDELNRFFPWTAQ